MQITERLVEENLNKLEQTGVLQRSNRLRLEDLLNPEPERQGVEGTVTDEDICQGVMAGKAAEENLLMVGGVDDDDDDAEILPRSSRKATLEAAATLERYVSVLEESSGYA